MKKLLYVVTEDWYFLSHRLPMARAAKAAGYEVAVAARISSARTEIEAQGISVIPLAIDRRSFNPLAGLATIAILARIYRSYRPDIVHHIAMKPVLYGSIAALFTPVPVIINAFAGLGFLFVDKTLRTKILRAAILRVFKFLLHRKNTILLLQNDDDRACLLSARIAVSGRTVVIPGSGVDPVKFALSVPPATPPFICVFAGRMIGIKGLDNLREAFAILATQRPDIRLWLCGFPDPANPGSWSVEQLQEWQSVSRNVVYKGQCAMTDIWPQAHVAVQPSRGGEGVPKALLEAAASGRAIVATDVPGCRDLVRDGENGFLTPPGDGAALAHAIDRVCSGGENLSAMGLRSRAIVINGFTADNVEKSATWLYHACPVWISTGIMPSRD